MILHCLPKCGIPTSRELDCKWRRQKSNQCPLEADTADTGFTYYASMPASTQLCLNLQEALIQPVYHDFWCRFHSHQSIANLYKVTHLKGEVTIPCTPE